MGTAPSRSAQDLDRVRRRYRSLAPFYPIFELLLALPRDARRRAVRALRLPTGGRVLEVGCGTGRNLELLRAAVGPTGRVYGVDATFEMLEIARAAVRREGWKNVVLLHADAAELEIEEPFDGILFGLSYSVIPEAPRVLKHVWGGLRPGGRLVVLDAKAPPGAFGGVLLELGAAFSRRTVLGDPEKRPWEDLRGLASEVSTEPLGWAGYYLLVGSRNP